MKYVIQLFQQKHKKDISGDKRAVQKVRREVERAKRVLSSSHEVRVEIEALYDGIDFSTKLSRAKFEELNDDLFRKNNKTSWTSFSWC